MRNREIRTSGGTIEDREALQARIDQPQEQYDDGILTVMEPVTRLRRASTRAFTAEIMRVRTSWDGRGDEWVITYRINLLGVSIVTIDYDPDEVGAGECGELLALLRDARAFVRRLARLERRMRR